MVSTAMPGARCPLPSTAFSAYPVMNRTFRSGRVRAAMRETSNEDARSPRLRHRAANADGHFSRAIDLECDHDEHAWSVVKARAPEAPVELWQGARCVGSLVPGGEPELLRSESP